jgi:hypothetical protein
VDYLQRLKGHHGSDRGWDSADHIGAHTVVKGSPPLFLEYYGTCADDTSVARHVYHAVGRGGPWRAGLIPNSVLTSLERYVIVRLRWQRPLLRLEPGAQNFVGICGRRRRDLAHHGSGRNAEPMHLFGVDVRFAHFKARELHLQELVQRKLDGHVGESQESGRETGVEGRDAFLGIHFPKSVECVLVMPRRAEVFGRAGADLRHESCLDYPYRIRDEGGACAGRDGGEGACEPFVLWTQNLSAVLLHARGAVLTHSLVQKLLGRLVCAHVDGPSGDVAQQHGPEASVQAAHAVVPPDDAGGAGEALVHCARRSRVLPRPERALRLQAGLDDIERARHDARGDAGSRATQRIDGPVRQAGDVHGEAGGGRAPVGMPLRLRHVPWRIFSNDSRGRRLGIVRGHGMGWRTWR